MSDIIVTNWFGDLVSHASAVAEATTADDVVNVLKNPASYPSPVRAVGSNHSTAPCAVINGGTILKMSGMNKILDISNGTVTAEAGALYIDVAKELEKQNLQFYVNTEIGSLRWAARPAVELRTRPCPASSAKWAPTSVESKWCCLPAIFSRSPTISPS